MKWFGFVFLAYLRFKASVPFSFGELDKGFSVSLIYRS